MQREKASGFEGLRGSYRDGKEHWWRERHHGSPATHYGDRILCFLYNCTVPTGYSWALKWWATRPTCLLVGPCAAIRRGAHHTVRAGSTYYTQARYEMSPSAITLQPPVIPSLPECTLVRCTQEGCSAFQHPRSVSGAVLHPWAHIPPGGAALTNDAQPARIHERRKVQHNTPRDCSQCGSLILNTDRPAKAVAVCCNC